MPLYCAEAFGWMTVLETSSHERAVRQAKALAPSASLLSTDIQPGNVRLATQEDIGWHRAMSGG